MMLRFLTIDLESITSSIDRSKFSESSLEMLADAIVASGGVISPILLRKTGFEKYEVIERHFEYYGAVRASEKEPKKPEFTEVNALIISDADETAVANQLKAVPQIVERVTVDSEGSSLDLRLTNMELRFERFINELRAEEMQEQQRLEARFSRLESQIALPKNKLESQVTPQKNPLTQINTLSQTELAVKLQSSGISGAVPMATALVKARQKKQNQQFEDYWDVVKSVERLGERRMLTIIDNWSR